MARTPRHAVRLLPPDPTLQAKVRAAWRDVRASLSRDPKDGAAHRVSVAGSEALASLGTVRSVLRELVRVQAVAPRGAGRPPDGSVLLAAVEALCEAGVPIQNWHGSHACEVVARARRTVGTTGPLSSQESDAAYATMRRLASVEQQHGLRKPGIRP